MKVLIADKFEQIGIDRLKELGCEVVSEPGASVAELPELIEKHDPEVLIVRSTRVGADALDRANSLSVIIRAGAGFDTIDVHGASERGISVCNCPGRNSIAVAELTWGLILCCDRRIPDQVAELRQKKWNKKEYSQAAGLYGRTLGVLGLGQIGREVAERGRAFGMNILAWSRSLTPEQATAMGYEYAATPQDVAKNADVITVHLAATDDTANLIDRKFCDALKPGAYIINTSRGSIVDQDALCDVVRKRGVRAGLDVYANEPGSGDNRFDDGIATQEGVYGTHHVGASTAQAQEAIALETVRIVEGYMRSGQTLHCVNEAEKTPATNMLTIRMANQPGVLAHIFYILGQAGINVEQMDNIIYEGAKAACAHIALDEPAPEELLTAIRANPHVISAACTSI